MLPPVRKYIKIQKVAKLVRVEMSSLCSERVDSMLRNHCKDSLINFDWDDFKAELLSNAPVLVSLLEACTHTKTPRTNTTSVIGMRAALMLKHRFTQMSLVQKIVSLVLYAGHSDKQVVISIADVLVLLIL